MEKLKVAVIGVGSISKFHIESYMKLPNVEVYAFCDIRPERLKMMGEKYGITRLYTDEAEMLAALPEIDMVSVCTWNSAHAPCAIMALNAGKHVLVEKPMATTVEEGLAMKEAAEKNGKLLMIAFVRRYGRDCEVVKDFIADGQMGELYYAKANYLRRHGNPGGWFSNVAMSGGGPLIDLGVHVIDLARYLFGNPKPVSAYGAAFHKLGSRDHLNKKKQNGEYVASTAGDSDICNCEDFASAIVRFDNGAVLNVEVSFDMHSPSENGLKILGTKAGVHILDNGVKFYNETAGYLTDIEIHAKSNLDIHDAFADEIRHFVNCTQGKAECKSPAEDGVELMKILRAIYKSAETGHEVVID